MKVILVALGGGLGAVSRYLIGLWINRISKIPKATLIINLLGAFSLGLFFNNAYNEIPISDSNASLYFLLGIGFFGAFTTFSTFSVETIIYLQKKRWTSFINYISMTIIGSILLFYLGLNI